MSVTDGQAGGNPGMAASTAEGVDGKTDVVKQRLHSLDAYRGLVMTSLAFGGFGLAKTAGLQLQDHPDSSFWTAVQYQFSHVQWVGCAFWDLLQASFMFMVGVSMAYSYLRRQREGQSYGRMLGHALWRSLVLILLGVFLSSNWSSITNWTFMNVLSQIGLGYLLLFLLWGRSPRTHAVTAGAILMVTWLLYVCYPGRGVDIGAGAPEVGVSPAWAADYLDGVSPAWHKNANIGHAADRWFLNLFPREKPFVYNSGGYQTLNFLPALATMLFGLMCGEWLRSDRSSGKKLLGLVLAGLGGLLLGVVLNGTGVCPVVKRIWTPAWALFSTGWCCLILALMYLVVDMLRLRFLVFPLVVVGMNSIATYCMGMLLRPWTEKTLKIHFGDDLFLLCGPAYEPMLQACLVGLCFWLVCLWLYRRRYFIRI
jgi:predicted acyltransferase